MLTAAYVSALNLRFENRPVRDILAWAIAHYGSKLSFSLGFGAEGMMILDIMMKLDPHQAFDVFTLETFRFPRKHYDLVRKCESEETYGLRLRKIPPPQEKLDELKLRHGKKPWLTPEGAAACCKCRKADQMPEALEGCEAWISSVRREQAGKRESAPIFLLDQLHTEHPLLRIHPLAFLTEGEVWKYIHEKDVPYNALYRKRYRAMSCMYPCIGPTPVGGKSRDGRFPLHQIKGHKTECGINFAP